jgi:hypothetical protein
MFAADRLGPAGPALSSTFFSLLSALVLRLAVT